MRVLTRA
jgi:mannosyltransferase OCH1-like enzyme